MFYDQKDDKVFLFRRVKQSGIYVIYRRTRRVKRDNRNMQKECDIFQSISAHNPDGVQNEWQE